MIHLLRGNPRLSLWLHGVSHFNRAAGIPWKSLAILNNISGRYMKAFDGETAFYGVPISKFNDTALLVKSCRYFFGRNIATFKRMKTMTYISLGHARTFAQLMQWSWSSARCSGIIAKNRKCSCRHIVVSLFTIIAAIGEIIPKHPLHSVHPLENEIQLSWCGK